VRRLAVAVVLITAAACANDDVVDLGPVSTACDLLSPERAESIAGDALTRAVFDDEEDFGTPTGGVTMCAYEGDGEDSDGEPLPRLVVWLWPDAYESAEELAETIAEAAPAPDIAPGAFRSGLQGELGIAVFIDDETTFMLTGAGVDPRDFDDLARDMDERLRR